MAGHGRRVGPASPGGGVDLQERPPAIRLGVPQGGQRPLADSVEASTASSDGATWRSVRPRVGGMGSLGHLAQPKVGQPVVVRTAISDFRQQQRIHLNDFAGLSTVAENAAYTNLAWGDSRESYLPAKRGNLVVVTLESIVND